ncbi:MAG: ATP-binding protein [Pseudomonadota bacterium]
MTGSSQTLIQRTLALCALLFAGALLALLLLLSSDPQQAISKHADQRLRFLDDAASGLEDRLEGRDATTVDPVAIAQLREGIHSVLPAAGADLIALYRENGALDQLRRKLLAALSSVRDIQVAQPEQIQVQLATLEVEWSALIGALEDIEQAQAAALTASETLTDSNRSLVSGLRLRGLNELAGALYESERALRAGLSVNLAGLARQPRYFEPASASLSSADKTSIDRLNATAQTLVAARSQLATALDGLSVAGFRSALTELREQLAQDALARLAVVNEARILLNMYTLLLLGVLAYFGFRLARSYQALNRSHDDLELRVQERTQDLEQALSELKDSQSQLVQAEKLSSLGQLVAGVMHEINTPLLYVQNNVSVTAEMTEELKAYLDLTLPLLTSPDLATAQSRATTIYRQRERYDADALGETATASVDLTRDSIEGLNQISELVQSLKDFSRLDRAAEDRYDVREGLEKTLVITRNLLKTGVKVTKDFGEVPEILCAPSRINQIFINLITNAVQAMDGKGELSLSTRDAGDWVEIVIEDSGCGIAADDLERIMDPFFTTKPVGQGTGLGLSIVNKIVHDHGGQILVDSQVGQGTRFTLGFPAAEQTRPIPLATESANDDGEEAA